jgi:hypothetical protein
MHVGPYKHIRTTPLDNAQNPNPHNCPKEQRQSWNMLLHTHLMAFATLCYDRDDFTCARCV